MEFWGTETLIIFKSISTIELNGHWTDIPLFSHKSGKLTKKNVGLLLKIVKNELEHLNHLICSHFLPDNNDNIQNFISDTYHILNHHIHSMRSDCS